MFSVCVSQRAADGLLLGLDDLRFEVRFQCARSLAAIRREEPDGPHRPGADLRGRPARGGGRPSGLGKPSAARPQFDDADRASFVDEFVKDRANRAWRTSSRCCRWCCRRSRCRSRFAGCTPTIRTCAARRSSTSRACCRRRFASVCGRFSRTTVRQTGVARPRERDPRRPPAVASIDHAEPGGTEAARRRRAPDDPETMSDTTRKAESRRGSHSTFVGRGRGETGPMTGTAARRSARRTRSGASSSSAASARGLWTFGLVMDGVVLPATVGVVVPSSAARHRGVRRPDLAAVLFLYVRYGDVHAADETDVGLVVHAGQRRRPSPLLNTLVGSPTVEDHRAPVLDHDPHPDFVDDHAEHAAQDADRVARRRVDGSARRSGSRTCAVFRCRRSPARIVLLHAELRVRDRRHAAVAPPAAHRPPAARSAGSRQLPADRTARPRRHGRSLAGPASAAGARRGDQARPSRSARRRQR